MNNADERELKERVMSAAGQFTGGMSTCWKDTALLTAGEFQSEKCYKITEELMEEIYKLIINNRKEMLKYFIETGEEAKKLLELITSTKETT